MPVAMRWRARTVAAALVTGAWAAACTATPLGLEDGNPAHAERVIVVGGGTLRQQVSITPAAPATGDTIAVHSALLNIGPTSVPYVATICGVHLQGTLAYADPFVRCGGYSTAGDLAPGDSLTDSRRVVVTAPPGEWTLEVRHLLEPSVWVGVPVQVRAP